MKPELKAVTKQYEYRDESGYHFTVTATYDPEFGWSASVSIGVDGLKTDEAALGHLVHPLRHALRMLGTAEEREQEQRLREALGLLSTLAPQVVMNPDDPVAMAKETAAHVEKMRSYIARKHDVAERRGGCGCIGRGCHGTCEWAVTKSLGAAPDANSGSRSKDTSPESQEKPGAAPEKPGSSGAP